MPDKPQEDDAERSPAQTAKKLAKRKERRRLRLQVATQLLAHAYPTHSDKEGGLGAGRLEAALRVADELIEMNTKLALRGDSKETAES
jgi:hypothetical protein